MTRRGAGDGTIRERANGTWEARYRAGDGRQRSIYAKTRGEARDRLRVALAAVDAGIRPVSSVLTVGAWLDEWLLTSVTPRCRPRTLESYRDTVDRYIRPALGRLSLAKLEPAHVSRMLSGLTARGDLSPTTVRYAYAVLRIALGRAMKAGKVVRNVCTLVDPPAKAKVDLRPLSADQVGDFLESVAERRDGALYVVAIGTGLRQGELLGLRWSDVDLEVGTLTVRNALERRTRELVEPKTSAARRTLRLGGEVLASLRAQRRRQLEERVAAGGRWMDADYVFTTPLGRPLDHAHVRRDFQAAIAAAALPHQRFHDLRHACATLLIEQGEELGVVSKILGHSNIATTADVYAHLTPAMAQRAADRLDTVLRRRPALG